MPRYGYRCPEGHDNEVTASMEAIPTNVVCSACGAVAARVFTVPAAIHFKGPGFYTTDVRGTLHRKRRSNVGDDLPKEFDHGAARVADAI